MMDKLYHTALGEGDVGRYVLLPGDPGRVEAIAAHFDNPHFVAYHREYKTMTGTLCGQKVSVTSTGIGGPSTAIAVEELRKVGADTFIRVGTCGSMQPYVFIGDVAVATGAIRAEGTSKEYLPVEFPAVADYDVLCALAEAGKKSGRPCHVGVVQCKDSFFGQHEPGRMPIAAELNERWQAWIRGGCLVSEMETAALFVIASTLGARAGTVLSVAGSQDPMQKNPSGYDIEDAIKVAVDAVRTLIALDAKKAE